jgi:2-polyprenyl-3-methyl-5-hydroxy-6-metoxy-1,4-benzoquinol methylase
MKSSDLKITSPLTGSTDLTLLRNIPAEYLIQGWKQEFQIDIREELGSNSVIKLYQCNQTKLKFFMPLDLVGSGQLYEKLQKFDWYYMPNKWEHQLALRDLQGCQKILEIGSGFGDFVESGIQAGLDICGIELNELAVATAKRRNLPVQRLDLKDAAATYQGLFDGVCSFQVLEHVCNPKEFIEWSVQMLKPGGKLIFGVPDADGFQKYQDFLLDMPPHHMHQWSASTFESLETLFPIKLEKIVREPLARYHIRTFLSAYAHRFPTPVQTILFNRYLKKLYFHILSLGLFRMLPGMSLYALFRKV